MTSHDFALLLPLIVMACTAALLMLVVSFLRNHALTATLTLAGHALAFAALFTVSGPARDIGILLRIDDFARFYMALVLGAGFFTTLFAWDYFHRQEGRREELYILLSIATLGCMTLTAATHFVSFFLGLEILTVALYGMIAYLRPRVDGIEAALKYLVLAAVSAAFLLFGMALVYAATGGMSFSTLTGEPSLLLLSGMALMIVGFGFKLAIVPFHMWTADVYEGAVAPVTGYIATASKGAMVAVLLRFYLDMQLSTHAQLVLVFTLLAIASMLAGNLLALLQTNVKRILAYSSIAHLGYVLVGVLAADAPGVAAVSYYLVAYTITTLVGFGVLGVLSAGEAEPRTLEHLRGLAWRRPVLAAMFTASLLSLAGIPLTAGFIGKFYILVAGIQRGYWYPVFALAVGSAIGIVYYLRVVVAMFTAGEGDSGLPLSAAGGVALAVLVVLLIYLGVWPATLDSIVRETTPVVFYP